MNLAEKVHFYVRKLRIKYVYQVRGGDIIKTKALVNGKVYSPRLGSGVITGDAVFIKDKNIHAVGSYHEIEKYIEDDTEVIDCNGKSIIPGLCDAHCHPSVSASAHSGCDLFGIYIKEGETEEDIIDMYLERLKQYIDNNPNDDLIRGTGWVFTNFMGERIPTRHDIDSICKDKPVILESFCQHNLWVNTKAIELAGLDEDTPDVYTGKIYRDNDGFPQGIFKDPEAMDLIKTGVEGYDFSVEKYKDAFLYYQKNYANKYGVTLSQDCMLGENAKEAFKQLANEGKLTVRIRGVYLLEPNKSDEQLSKGIEQKGNDNVGDDFRIDTVKIFTEGPFSLIEPYAKTFTEPNGLPLDYNEPLYWTDKELIDASARAMDEGFNVHIHAMGDNAVRQSVECLAEAQDRLQAGNDYRNVIAHLMLIRDKDVVTMAEKNIIANCQPRWMVYDSDVAGMVDLIGEHRAEASYPLRTFLDNKVTVAFGTDFPVTPPPDTMHEIQCAMTRKVFPDAPDYESFKDKRLGTEKGASLEDAIRSLSINGAYQMFAENITGSIEPGKSADLVVLDSDIENTDVNSIYDIKVLMTLFKGEVVFKK